MHNQGLLVTAVVVFVPSIMHVAGFGALCSVRVPTDLHLEHLEVEAEIWLEHCTHTHRSAFAHSTQHI